MKKHTVGVEDYSVSDVDPLCLPQETQQFRMEQRLPPTTRSSLE